MPLIMCARTSYDQCATASARNFLLKRILPLNSPTTTIVRRKRRPGLRAPVYVARVSASFFMRSTWKRQRCRFGWVRLQQPEALLAHGFLEYRDEPAQKPREAIHDHYACGLCRRMTSCVHPPLRRTAVRVTGEHRASDSERRATFPLWVRFAVGSLLQVC